MFSFGSKKFDSWTTNILILNNFDSGTKFTDEFCWHISDFTSFIWHLQKVRSHSKLICRFFMDLFTKSPWNSLSDNTRSILSTNPLICIRHLERVEVVHWKATRYLQRKNFTIKWKAILRIWKIRRTIGLDLKKNPHMIWKIKFEIYFCLDFFCSFLEKNYLPVVFLWISWII